jgi:hypothetical protein
MPCISKITLTLKLVLDRFLIENVKVFMKLTMIIPKSTLEG